MGSYNVSCGISSISISCGMRTKLIFLLPHRYNQIIGKGKVGQVVLDPTITHVSFGDYSTTAALAKKTLKLDYLIDDARTITKNG